MTERINRLQDRATELRNLITKAMEILRHIEAELDELQPSTPEEEHKRRRRRMGAVSVIGAIVSGAAELATHPRQFARHHSTLMSHSLTALTATALSVAVSGTIFGGPGGEDSDRGRGALPGRPSPTVTVTSPSPAPTSPSPSPTGSPTEPPTPTVSTSGPTETAPGERDGEPGAPMNTTEPPPEEGPAAPPAATPARPGRRPTGSPPPRSPTAPPDRDMTRSCFLGLDLAPLLRVDLLCST